MKETFEESSELLMDDSLEMAEGSIVNWTVPLAQWNIEDDDGADFLSPSLTAAIARLEKEKKELQLSLSSPSKGKKREEEEEGGGAAAVDGWGRREEQ